jgi:carboxyl-terminal processing protease
MSKLARFLLAIPVTVALSVSLFAQSNESTPEIRQKTFEKVWKTVNEKFFDPNFGGVNWKEVRARYAQLIAAAKTDDEFYRVLANMLGELHSSHLEVVRPEEFSKAEEPPVTTGLSLKEIDGQVMISRILKNSAAAGSAMRPGFLLKTIDGAEIKSIGDALEKIHGKAGTKVALGYLDEKDELRQITLERRVIPPGEIDKQTFGQGAAIYALFDSSRLADGIGYIHFTSFITPFQQKVRDAIGSMRGAPGIVIDLRGNGGGDDRVGLAMANALFAKKTLLMITRTRKGDDNYYTAKPGKDPYTGQVVILLDQESGSASEQFAAGMQEAGRATIIGKTSVGADMDADVIALPTGALFVYAYGQPRTPGGVVIEGRGVIPDIDVDLLRKDLLAGRDTQLEAAIAFIKAGGK